MVLLLLGVLEAHSLLVWLAHLLGGSWLVLLFEVPSLYWQM
jgi:hypothetical protein